MVVNRNGEAGTIPGTGNIGGCDSDFRYWEKRDDFSVANRTTVLLSYDVRDTGSRRCELTLAVDVVVLGLKAAAK